MMFCNLSVHLSGCVPHEVPVLCMLHFCASNYCKRVQLNLISTQLNLKHCQEQSVFSTVLRNVEFLHMQEFSLFLLPLLSARVFKVSRRVLSFLAHSENYLPYFGTSYLSVTVGVSGTSQSTCVPTRNISSIFDNGDISHCIPRFIFRLFHSSLVLFFHLPRKKFLFSTSHIWEWSTKLFTWIMCLSF